MGVQAGTVGDHAVTVHTGNGYGSINTKIRRFTTTLASAGTAITYADSETLGASFTINEAGMYAMSFVEETSGPAQLPGISLNTSQPTIGIYQINVADRLIFAFTPVSAGCYPAVSCVAKLAPGDVIRAHTDGNSIAATSATTFRIRKVSP